ncbi:MAG: hypothetical protein H6Q37_1445 [Chloroflexi bacterium]|nr:hypothetical protein [Chloroflexota bacterium]
MLFQTAPAATTSYMIAGYVVIFGGLALYLISLVVRRNNLKQDLEILAEEQGTNDATDQKS